jgi:predicted RNase H-like HicB family nuclease
MKYQVLLHQQPDGSFRASVVELPHIEADGKTDQEALVRLKEVLTTQLSSNAIEFAPPLYDNSRLTKYAGVFQADPTWDDYLAEIERYRREVDETEAAKEALEEAA